MKKPNITKGEFALVGNYIHSTNTGEKIAWICGDGPQPQWKPNGKFLAAAPKMAEALEMAYATLMYAAQEAKGKVKAEIVGGWLHHAQQAREALTLAGYEF